MREKSQVLSEFVLKIIAIVTMTFDHIGAFIVQSAYSAYFPTDSVGYAVGRVFRGIGRLSFPLFALMLAEGMRKTKDREAYLLRIGIVWVLITAVETFFYFNTKYASFALENAFTDLIMYALFIYLIEKKGAWKGLAILPLAYIVLSFAADTSETYALNNSLTSVWSASFPLFLRCPYSLYGFLIFLGFYYAYPLADKAIKKSVEDSGSSLEVYRTGKEYRSLVNLLGITAFLFVTVIFWGLSYLYPTADIYTMSFQTYCLLDIFLLGMYSGARGYDKKGFRYAEYAYYPLHLALIALIFGLVFK
jgi:hypothetical protein